MWVLIVDMLKKLLVVFCLIDDRSVINKPKPQAEWVWEGVKGKYYEQV